MKGCSCENLAASCGVSMRSLRTDCAIPTRDGQAPECMGGKRVEANVYEGEILY